MIYCPPTLRLLYVLYFVFVFQTGNFNVTHTSATTTSQKLSPSEVPSKNCLATIVSFMLGRFLCWVLRLLQYNAISCQTVLAKPSNALLYFLIGCISIEDTMLPFATH